MLYMNRTMVPDKRELKGSFLYTKENLKVGVFSVGHKIAEIYA
jgi:hypothetical protein